MGASEGFSEIDWDALAIANVRFSVIVVSPNARDCYELLSGFPQQCATLMDKAAGVPPAVALSKMLCAVISDGGSHESDFGGSLIRIACVE
ncbi:hypothetical protein [Rhizobium sp. BK251]|uniref:hypothetical protein n=1 Tax=Rhizobium sp. BK251 TaxID=2512125 RepID=UPI00104D83D7|nr:hypothetical protein [Rhizobium sp. BK251]TCL69830.1 hypothetical protein EV286_108408 [Rhizobium sp. BK251]